MPPDRRCPRPARQPHQAQARHDHPAHHQARQPHSATPALRHHWPGGARQPDWGHRLHRPRHNRRPHQELQPHPAHRAHPGSPAALDADHPVPAACPVPEACPAPEAHQSLGVHPLLGAHLVPAACPPSEAHSVPVARRPSEVHPVPVARLAPVARPVPADDPRPGAWSAGSAVRPDSERRSQRDTAAAGPPGARQARRRTGPDSPQPGNHRREPPGTHPAPGPGRRTRRPSRRHRPAAAAASRGAGRRGGGRSTRLRPTQCPTSQDRATRPSGARRRARDGHQPHTCHGRGRRHHVPPGHLLKTPKQTRPLHAALHPEKSVGRAECPVGAESILCFLPGLWVFGVFRPVVRLNWPSGPVGDPSAILPTWLCLTRRRVWPVRPAAGGVTLQVRHEHHVRSPARRPDRRRGPPSRNPAERPWWHSSSGWCWRSCSVPPS
jgi:hypothetical protein